jgi:hypothetical protein
VHGSNRFSSKIWQIGGLPSEIFESSMLVEDAGGCPLLGACTAMHKDFHGSRKSLVKKNLDFHRGGAEGAEGKSFY